MSKSSYVVARFSGGPRDGETAETPGEPKRLLAVNGSTGLYRWEWDRDSAGLRQRTGQYTWAAPDGGDLVEPTSGDEASALMEHAGGQMANKPGASITPVPDVTVKAAEPVVADVAAQVAAIEEANQTEPPRNPDSRPQGDYRPMTGDEASAAQEPTGPGDMQSHPEPGTPEVDQVQEGAKPAPSKPEAKEQGQASKADGKPSTRTRASSPAQKS